MYVYGTIIKNKDYIIIIKNNNMKITKKHTSVLTFLFLAMLSMYAQKKVVQGKITLFKTIAVEGAEIGIKKTGHKTFSDSLGVFTIECNSKDKLYIRATGFKTKQLKVKKLKDFITVDLAIASDKSDIELAVSKGHIKQNDLSLAIKYFDSMKQYSFGYTNIFDLISDKFPQASIVKGEIILRGINSISEGGKNGAIIVLDGAISSMNSLESINLSDIKDIRILRGTEAIRYGTGSSNGVISVRLISN